MQDEVPSPPPPIHSLSNISEIQALQAATASEPLSLPDEYTMQSSWRSDPDKLTFIICRSPTLPGSTRSITPETHDNAETMVGDVNLFLYPDPDFEMSSQTSLAQDGENPGALPVIGELEIMLAPASSRRQGLATASLLAFMSYITSPARLPQILEEYRLGSDERSERYLRYLRVKVDQGNQASLGLFGKVGFERVGEVNYFGEVELRLEVEGVREVVRGKEVGKVVGYSV
jgi:RimJ/RimL family protein N-acetyltransferase